jgi:uncharacterized RDD family membrane protein YckC
MERDADEQFITRTDPVEETRFAETVAPKADLTRRAIAAIIDAVIASVLGIIPAVGWLLGGAYILLRDGLDVDYLHGRSLGKTLMKLRPVRLDGQPMDLMTSVKRNWMFALGLVVAALALIPILGWLLIPFVLIASPIILIVEIIRVFTDPRGRRWGDLLAGTVVIETED